MDLWEGVGFDLWEGFGLMGNWVGISRPGLCYSIAFTSMPTKALLNYAAMPIKIPMYPLAVSTLYKQCWS